MQGILLMRIGIAVAGEFFPQKVIRCEYGRF